MNSAEGKVNDLPMKYFLTHSTKGQKSMSTSTVPLSEPQKGQEGICISSPLPHHHLSYPSVHSSQGSTDQKSNTQHIGSLSPNVKRHILGATSLWLMLCSLRKLWVGADEVLLRGPF